MTLRFPTLLCLAGLLALPARADAPSAAEHLAQLDQAVEKGLFLVLADAGVNLAIIGRAPEGLGQGALRRLDSGRGDLIVAAQALRPDHPASLDTLPRRPLRIATSDGYCSARLGRVYVVDVASRDTMNTHREERMEDADEADEVWAGGGYVAAVIERGCRDGILATTRISASRARSTRQDPSPELRSQAELAYGGSAAAREASMYRATEAADGGGVIATHTFSLSESHRVTFVSEVIHDVWHCSGSQQAFTMVLEERSGVLRRIGAPRMDFEPAMGALILDVDGDGALEVVLQYDGTSFLFELRSDQDQLVPLGTVGVSYEIGC
ncbi:MAG: hypothetical protein IPG17_22410 [Sandaracinaceae bacterium]|jgi:hypothetical protein|nr:hypothetical protein [Sandaracinaceae bacterium]MBP7682414.1 hypothetical protein [Deltaproteobacteria bacterium]MBK6808856.1 hypothetical protein [Sandaracinaceae bacterium]MBK7153280.1 hypothetical protein [Sandaracinaceae bacterium]MBK7772812.1 hypothetical protein [Sandaracinaceae bacterium]